MAFAGAPTVTAIRSAARPPRRRRLRRARVAQAAFVAVVLGALVGALATQYARTSALARQATQLEQRRRDLIQQNDRLRTEITRLRTDDAYIELLARQQLGLVRPGEIELLIVKPGTGQPVSDQPNALQPTAAPPGLAQRGAGQPPGGPADAGKTSDTPLPDLHGTSDEDGWLSRIRPILAQMFEWLHRHMPTWKRTAVTPR
jgi:cell division protein FtsB